MIGIGIALPAKNIGEVVASANAATEYDFDSFSVYGDLGDLPPYEALLAAASVLRLSNIATIGPMGISPIIMGAEDIISNAVRLSEILPERTYVGIVRGAFLESVNKQPCGLGALMSTVAELHETLIGLGYNLPIYLGGFGPSLHKLAGASDVAGIKLGGSANIGMASIARENIDNESTKLILGAVSVVDEDRTTARMIARQEVAKYLNVVGALDPTLNGDEIESLHKFRGLFKSGQAGAYGYISDGLLDKFAMAGTPNDVLVRLDTMKGVVDRFEFGTPHGLGSRPEAIKYIANTILKEMRT